VDETYVGGKGKNRHGKHEKNPRDHGRSLDRKSVVIGAVERKGNVVARVIEHADLKTIVRFVEETVSHKVSLVAHDDYQAYRALPTRFNHAAITHRDKQYVVGAVHTNTIEGFWSILKRGVVGTYHKVSRKYLPLYVAEFQFRYNNRNNEDIFGEAIKGC
jgi:IS1 family transposase